MPAQPYELELYTSGSGAPASYNLCLGGAINVVVPPQSVAASMSGVAVIGGRGLIPGSNALLGYLNTFQTLRFRGNGGATYGSEIPVGAGGIFAIPDDGNHPLVEGRRVLVNVTPGSLPVSDVAVIANVTNNAANTRNLLFTDVSTSQQDAGYTRYRCFYIRNDNGLDNIENIRLFLTTQPVWPTAEVPVSDTFSIGLDPAGIGDGTGTGVAQVILDEPDTAMDLTGVTFSQPTQVSPLVVGNLSPGECIAVWFRMIVPALSFTEGATDQPYAVFSAEMELP